MAKQKLMLLSELFYPETTATAFIMTEIAKTLAKKYEVHVVAGNPVYDVGEDAKPLDGIFVHRLKGRKIDKNNKIAHLFRAVTLSTKMTKVLDEHKNEFDKVFMVTNPVFLVLKISAWCKKNDKKFILLVHDVFPENAIQTKMIKSPFFARILKNKFDSAYKNASLIITCGNDMKSVVEEKIEPQKIPVVCIPNWANTEEIFPLPSADESEKFVIQFSGNMGRVQGLKKLFGIIEKVKNENLEFRFAGSGAVLSELKKITEQKKLECVKFLPAYSRNNEAEILSACDMALVCLDERMFGLGVPSKTYNNMVAGKPILFVGPKNSDIYNEVIENKIGFAFGFDEENEILSFLNGLDSASKEMSKAMGEKARKRAEEAYCKEKILQKYLKII